MISRPPGPDDAHPWPGHRQAAPQPPRPRDNLAPCQGCRHLFVRYADGGPGRPSCGQGVEYGQPGCLHGPRRGDAHG